MAPPSPTPIQTARAEVEQCAVEAGALGAVAVVVPEVELEAARVEALVAVAAWWPLPQPARASTPRTSRSLGIGSV